MSSLHRWFRRATPPVAVVLLATGCGSSKQHFTVRHAPLTSIFEAPMQLISTPGPTLDLLRHLGVEDVRIIVRWSSIAPAPSARRSPKGFNASAPGAYPSAGWAPYDALVRQAAARHMGVLFNVSGPAPLWASGRGAPSGGVPGVWRPSAAKFRSFVHAVGIRYSGHYKPPGSPPLPRVSFWSVWNEPNLGQADLAPQAIHNSKVESSPQMYRGLLESAWVSLRATGHGRDTILIGELAPYGQSVGNSPGDFGEMVPMRFVRALYCVDSSMRPLRDGAAAARGCPTTAAASKRFARENPGLFGASGFAVHPYASGETTPPNVVLPVGPDFVYLATLSRLTRFLDGVTSLYGASRRYPIYSTEYGYITDPPFPHGVPLTLAAKYLNWAEYMTWRSPRLRSWDQYLLVDPPSGGPSQFVTGLEFDTGAPKPSFAAYRMPIFLPVTHQPSGHGLEVWGCARPVHYLPGRQVVRIELRRRGQRGFEKVATVPVTNASCYFDTVVHFPAAGTVRLAWSYPRGPTIYSRLVSITAG